MSHFSIIFLTQDCQELPAEPIVSALFAEGQNNLKWGGTCMGSKKIWHNYHVNYSGCFKSPASETWGYTTCFWGKERIAFLPGDKTAILEEQPHTHTKKIQQSKSVSLVQWILALLYYFPPSTFCIDMQSCRSCGAIVKNQGKKCKGKLWKTKRKQISYSTSHVSRLIRPPCLVSFLLSALKQCSK